MCNLHEEQFFRMRNASIKFVEETQNIHCMLNTFFFPENRAIHEILWKSIVESDRPQTTLRGIHIACWVTKVTTPHSEHVIIIAFPQPEKVTLTRLTVTL